MLMHVSPVHLTAAGRTVHRYPGQVGQQNSQRCLLGFQVSITCEAQLEIIADLLGGIDLWQIPIVTGHSGHHPGSQLACVPVCLASRECVHEPPKDGMRKGSRLGLQQGADRMQAPNLTAISITVKQFLQPPCCYMVPRSHKVHSSCHQRAELHLCISRNVGQKRPVRWILVFWPRLPK